MKTTIRTLSFFAAALCWLLLSALTVLMFWAMRDRARLIRDNENEQLFNQLFTGLRDHDDFGSAIEADQVLEERITGFAVYGNREDDFAVLYSWGKAPLVFDEELLEKKIPQGKFGRYTIPDKKGNSVKFVLKAVRPPPPPAAGHHGEEKNQRMRRDRDRRQLPFFDMLARGGYYYIDISHPAYWRTITLTAIFLPLCSAAFLAAAFYIRRLYLRNREYRERIEAQKNLVVLGTAAGTLAHEIKNPLLSIRLQTGILRKTISGRGEEEIAIIEEEVERLSSLSRRVNDYLREGMGNPEALNVYDLILETGVRLCGRDIMRGASEKDAWVFADHERFRSVFENLIRNALESGGPGEEVEASLVKSGGVLTACVYDRGGGIAEGDLGRIFDPFFTRKSGGTGIGLSICKRFSEAARASISIENREGGGVAARISIPGYGKQAAEDR